MSPPTPFSSPEAAILVVSATDRDLWQGPKQEVRESRTSGFCAQPQKFETITVTIGYKMGSYCACALPWPPPEVSIRGASQKDRSSGDENAPTLSRYYRIIPFPKNSVFADHTKTIDYILLSLIYTSVCEQSASMHQKVRCERELTNTFFCTFFYQV